MENLKRRENSGMFFLENSIKPGRKAIRWSDPGKLRNPLNDLQRLLSVLMIREGDLRTHGHWPQASLGSLLPSHFGQCYHLIHNGHSLSTCPACMLCLHAWAAGSHHWPRAQRVCVQYPEVGFAPYIERGTSWTMFSTCSAKFSFWTDHPVKSHFPLPADWASWIVVTLRSQEAHPCCKVSLGPTWPSDEQQSRLLILFFSCPWE